jgi:hypothetical protein
MFHQVSFHGETMSIPELKIENFITNFGVFNVARLSKKIPNISCVFCKGGSSKKRL